MAWQSALWRCGQADHRQVGAAARSDLIAALGKPAGFPRGQTELTYCSGGLRRTQYLRYKHLRLRPHRKYVVPSPRPVAGVDAAAPSRWRTIFSQPWGKESSSSRQPGNKWPVIMRTPPSQLKASQEHMARPHCQGSEQNLRPRIPAPPPRFDCHFDAANRCVAPVAPSHSTAAGREKSQ